MPTPFRAVHHGNRSSIRKLHEGFPPKKVKAAFMTLPQLQNQGINIYTYIGNIIGILLCYNLHHYYYILLSLSLYIYRKCWLINRLCLLIILNLVSKPLAIRTLLSFSSLQLSFPLPLLNGLYCCCCRLLPHHRWCSPADQPSTSC